MDSWRQHAGHRHDADRLGPGPGRLPGAGQRDLLHLGRRHAELFLRCRRAAYRGGNQRHHDATYNWDANGNPSNFDANGNPAGTSYVIANDNELLYDGTYRYAYDGEGNCVLRFKDPGDIDTIPTGSNGDTDITVYQWDARGRLSEAVEYPTLFGVQRQPGRPKSSTTFTTRRTAGSARTSATAAG